MFNPLIRVSLISLNRLLWVDPSSSRFEGRVYKTEVANVLNEGVM